MIYLKSSPHQNAKNISKGFLNSPLGVLKIELQGGKINSVTRVSKRRPNSILPSDAQVMARATKQIHKYFSGELKKITLPLIQQGTEFQREVWSEMAKIPFGSTLSYAAIARAIGRPRAFRAVGNACNKNPYLLVVPCHRVVATFGLGGFALGAAKKRLLLKHETESVS